MERALHRLLTSAQPFQGLLVALFEETPRATNHKHSINSTGYVVVGRRRSEERTLDEIMALRAPYSAEERMTNMKQLR